MLHLWWFPEIGLPLFHHPFLDGIFHEINQPASLGYDLPKSQAASGVSTVNSLKPEIR